MKLYHATTAANLASILTHGLLVAKADPAAKLIGVWACSKSQIGWAILHTQRKHKATLADVVVIEVEVTRSWLNHFRRGLWYSKRDITPEQLGAVIAGESFGASASE